MQNLPIRICLAFKKNDNNNKLKPLQKSEKENKTPLSLFCILIWGTLGLESEDNDVLLLSTFSHTLKQTRSQ